jgi:sarcosine oxidase subunit beta
VEGPAPWASRRAHRDGVMKTADVVVVGGGVMGCSITYHLSREGCRVILLERDSQLGTGSTGRCSGAVRHQFSNPVNVQLSIESIRKLKAFEQEVGRQIDFHQDGYLFLLTQPETVAEFTRSVAMQRGLGVDSRLLTTKEVESLVAHAALDDVLAATYCSEDGIVDPYGVTVGYGAKAKELGAEILLGQDVVAVKATGGQVSAVRTQTAEFAAPVVVNAAGPWAAPLGRLAGVTLPIVPFRRHVYITGEFPEVPPNRLMVVDFETSFYFHREGVGVLMGMSDPSEPPSFEQKVDPAFLDRVIEAGVRRFPPLAGTWIRRAWAGLYEVTPDANPILGETPLRGFYVAGGFSGHGFMHGPIVGELMAELILTQKTHIDISGFGLERFSAAQLHREKNVV